MPNYVKLAETAVRLVRGAGRQVTFVRDSHETVAGKPWEVEEEDPVETPLYAASVEVGYATKLGLIVEDDDLLKKLKKVYVVEPTTEVLESYDRVADEDGDWKIGFVSTLRPAEVTLLHFVGVLR